MANVYSRLERERRPRVHIKYEVETGGAQVERELPFVVGVHGRLLRQSDQPLRPLKERKFVQIDRDNFNEVMAAHRAGPEHQGQQHAGGRRQRDGPVQLKFNSMEDFEPGRIVEQVPALKKLLDTRNQLRDLMTKVDRSEELEGLLERVLQNESDLKALSSRTRARQAGRSKSWPRRTQSGAPAAGATSHRGQPARPGDRRHQADRAGPGRGLLIKTLTEEALKGTVTFDQERHRHHQQGDRGARRRAVRSSSPRSCTTPTSRSWKGRGAGCTTWS